MKDFISIDLWCFHIIPLIDNAIDFHNVVVTCKKLYQQVIQSKCTQHRDWLQNRNCDTGQSEIIPTNICNFFQQKQIALAFKSIEQEQCNAAQAIARFLCTFNTTPTNHDYQHSTTYYELYPKLDFNFEFCDQTVPLKVAVISDNCMKILRDKIQSTTTHIVDLGISNSILQPLDRHIAESLSEYEIDIESMFDNDIVIVGTGTGTSIMQHKHIWGVGDKYKLLLKSVETGNILAVALCLDQLQFEIDYKALREHLNSFSIFFDSSRTVFPEFNFDTELHFAIENCVSQEATIDIIQYLLKYGNSDLVHVTDRHGHSPLIKAIIHNQLNVVKYLLENFEINANKIYYQDYGSIIFTNDDSYFVHQCSALMIALSIVWFPYL